MRLTVLGKSPAWSDAGGACSGYLVREGDTALVLDCGNGAFGKLRAQMPYEDVDAVLLSHLHGDHLLDLVPFSYALTLAPAGRAREGKPRLIAPLGARDFMRRLAGTWGDQELITGAFDLEEYAPTDEREVGGIAIRSHPVPHIGPTHAIELTAAAGGRIVFGADGRYSQELIAAARDADLLVAEATLGAGGEGGEEVHMTAEQAGRLAREAGAARLVLTHVSDELDVAEVERLAATAFGGEAEVAAEGETFEV
jgi:ribonuclease BN (tRNA processing enzyme)